MPDTLSPTPSPRHTHTGRDGSSPVARANLTDLWKRTGAIAETIDRRYVTATYSSLVSGKLYLVGGLTVPAGVTVSKITFLSGSTALVTGTAQWFSLYDTSRALLAVTADDGATAWAGNTEKTLTLVTPWTPSVDTAVYAGLVVVAATVPTLSASNVAVTPSGLAPIMAGGSSTGLTDPSTAPNPAGALAGQAMAYAWLS